MSYLKRLPWVQIIWPLAITIVYYAYTAKVQAEIRDQLKGYVTVNEFITYQQSHKEWTEEVIRRIDSSLQDIKQYNIDQNALLKELLSRRPPPNQTPPRAP